MPVRIRYKRACPDDPCEEAYLSASPLQSCGERGQRRAVSALAGICALAAAVALPSALQAQEPVPPAKQLELSAVPNFWDLRRRPERPDMSKVTAIRFLTETDFPPFNYAGPDDRPEGFNVDLARLICEEIKISCTIQMRRFDTLVPSLNENRGDAAIASMAPTAQLRQRVDFTDPYYRVPARFAARRDSPIQDIVPERMEGRKVAVAAGSAHEAYLRALFPEADIQPFATIGEARAAMRSGAADLVFGDGLLMAAWLNSAESGDCCAFRGGPFLDSKHFGEGIGIAVRKGNEPLRLALNWALFRLWENGRFADLWLRYFPINPF